jgi:hypothetical protein
MSLDLVDFRAHLERIKGSVTAKYTLADIPDFICKNTFIKGEPYSFKDHEFQEYIIRCEDEELNVQKCSQVGLSEIMVRWTMSVAYNYPAFSAIVTFPFNDDASNFARTRVDPFINSSPILKAAMSSDLNNSDTKMIKESLVYFRGTNGKTVAISTPADMIVSDEVDKSDPDILTTYTSRLTHSPYKWRRNFSTPTIKGYGISLLMEGSRRFVNLCKCDHCANWFKPDFFAHVKIPDFNSDLKELNKNTLPRYRYLEARLHCPKCGKEPNLYPSHREYVQENNESAAIGKGIFVSPFDAPAIITPVSLLKAMVQYSKISEFINQNLGLTSEDASESLTLDDLSSALTTTDLRGSSLHAMGIDMGVICHIVIVRLTLEGTLLVVHREKVHLSEFDAKRVDLKRRFNVAVTVCDSMPYVDTVLRAQRVDRNLFGAVFVESKALTPYEVKMAEEDKEKGKLPIHVVNIQKHTVLDELLFMFKRKEVVVQQTEDDLEDEFQKHCLDMKRVQVYDEKLQKLVYKWTKSEAKVDHFHHALLYAYVAARLRSTVLSTTASLAGAPLIAKFVVKAKPQEAGGYLIGRGG